MIPFAPCEGPLPRGEEEGLDSPWTPLRASRGWCSRFWTPQSSRDHLSRDQLSRDPLSRDPLSRDSRSRDSPSRDWRLIRLILVVQLDSTFSPADSSSSLVRLDDLGVYHRWSTHRPT